MTIDKYILIMLAVNTAGVMLVIGRLESLVRLLNKLTDKFLNNGNSNINTNGDKNDFTP